MTFEKILSIAAMVYGVLAAIVKVCPTIPDKFPWSILLFIIKILGKLTNNQTDDEAIRTTVK